MIHIIKIGADWCNNCNILSNDLNNIDYNDINYDNIEDLENELIEKYNNNIYNIIKNTDKLPTLYIIDNNTIKDKMIGYNINRKNELYNLLNKYNIKDKLNYDENF